MIDLNGRTRLDGAESVVRAVDLVKRVIAERGAVADAEGYPRIAGNAVVWFEGEEPDKVALIRSLIYAGYSPLCVAFSSG